MNKLKNMDSELFWNAVVTNDARFDGSFYLGLKTTGIFCKPSCRARLPKRENVTFFDAIDHAESNGFRACLRCKPAEEIATDPQVAAVLDACDLIAENDQISLDELGKELNISPAHLQRTFKEIVGVSPKKYSEIKRFERFKSGVRAGSDVTTAMYDAGYGSSSRLYEKATENLGMTPNTYKKGGKGMKINYTIANCELGLMLAARTTKGICSVTFGNTYEELEAGLRAEFPNAEITLDDRDLKTAADAIISYLGGEERRLILPLDLQATAFQMQVWDFLRKIPYGETRSYGEIAGAIGDKKKSRAVARACATNRVAVIIPCHRVVASDGKLSGYRWGVERKKTLLEKEKAA